MREPDADRPIVLITGAAGGIGSSLAQALKPVYRVVGFDRVESGGADADGFIVGDLTDDVSVEAAFRQFRDTYGSRIASVVHLAAYFDFTGEDNPLYDKVNVRGTRRLVRRLREFDVGQIVYAGTMLVHAPCDPGRHIDESAPIAPKWAYPRSKAATEEVIREERGAIPAVFLRLAGVYDDRTAVPTLAHQIARIYERDVHSHLYSGDLSVGQAFVHVEDMIEAFRRTIDRRTHLPPEVAILVGEPRTMSYRALQNRLGALIHGEPKWPTLAVPKPLAAAGAWVEEKLEPVIPDAFDEGQKPFIRPFMVAMSDDHYALDIRRARELLGWKPRHSVAGSLAKMVEALTADPVAWYRANKVETPPWMDAIAAAREHPHLLGKRHQAAYMREHGAWRWAAFMNVALGTWLASAPPILGYGATVLAWSDLVAGLMVMALGLVSLSGRQGWARWACAAVGVWLLCVPLLAWTPSAAAYANDTLVGALVIGFAVLARPAPGIDPVATLAGPTVPDGWDLSPSSWPQRIPIIVLAFVGLYVSRYLAAYQLGHIDGVWEPFFEGGPDPKNGTEEIITSWVSDAWPVSDAGVGAVTYLLEILTGVIGGANRWRTMPWLVLVFGIMIVPLGAVSIAFIIIQPILLGTWCTLCLIAAAAMVVQIPYSLDELVATGQFLRRRRQAGAPVLRVVLVGDTDEGGKAEDEGHSLDRPMSRIMRDMVTGGVGLPWNLAACLLIGAWLMVARLLLDIGDAMANADHLIGALVITVTAIALAEPARPVRFVNIALAFALLVTPFVYGAGWQPVISNVICGIALIPLSLPRGPVHGRYGGWSRIIV